MMQKASMLVFSVLGLCMATAATAQKPETDPAPTDGVFLGNGGSDSFGYTVVDDTSGECAVQFIDITGSGTAVGTGDDSGFPVTLDAPFNFYGSMLNSVAMTTNGYISTDDTDMGDDLSNDCPLPATPSSGSGGRIYPVQDDLIADSPGGMFYEFISPCPRPSDQFPGADLGCHVFHWDEATHFGGGGPWDYEVILYDQSWEIVFQHGAGNPETGSGSTTGIQNAAADIGLTYACDTADSVADNSAQCIRHPNPAVQQLPEAPAIPALNRIGLVLMGLVLAAVAAFALRRNA